MLKKSLAALAVVGGLTVPAVAHAVPTASTASNVQLAWVDGKVRITWTEPAGIPNGIAMEATGQEIKPLGTTTASGPNELVVPASALDPTNNPAAQARIIVTDPSTAEVRSAPFDRYIRGTSPFDPGMNGTGQLGWSFAPDSAVDTTPNDPLDVDRPERFVPQLTLAPSAGTAGACQVVRLPAAEYGTIPRQGKPYNLDMYAVNEWGASRIAGQRVRSSAITYNAPASSTFGKPVSMSGVMSLRSVKESPAGTCQEVADGADKARIQILLHARNSATSPWYVVNAAQTDAQGKYTFTPKNPGAREYRAVVTPSAGGGVAQYQSISASKIVRATTQVVEAKFISPTIRIGERPNAYLRVEPAGSQRAALQFKNASGVWQGLMYKTLSSGRGLSGPFAFNRLGQAQFRWWVPASLSSTGLPVDAVYSKTFTLTVL